MTTKILLTPEQKRINKIRSEVLTASNRAKSQFSFGKVKTYSDLLREFNYPDTYGPSEKLGTALVFADVKAFCEQQRLRLELTLTLWSEGKLPWWEFLPAKHDAVDKHKDAPLFEIPSIPITVDAPQVETIEDIVDEEQADDSKWRAFFKSPSQHATLYTKQFRAAAEIYQGFKKGQRTKLLIAGTGVGKTYMYGALLRKLTDEGYFERCMSPWPCIVVTKAKIVQQTERVLAEEFGLAVGTTIHVVNVEQLRSTFGKLFIHEQVTVFEGQESITYAWLPFAAPKMIVWDECQILKNTDTSQSRIAQGYNDLPDDAPAWCGEANFQLYSSATPFIKVSEAKVLCVASRVKMSFGIGGEIAINNRSWSDFARQVADPAKPEDKVEAAVARLMVVIRDYVVDVKNVRPQFKANNRIRMISFRNIKERERYQTAWDLYQEAKAKLEQRAYSKGAEPSRFEQLAVRMIFRMEAEDIRAEWLADKIIADLKEGFAPVLAVSFKKTIVSVCRLLHKKYGVTRDQISIIWGGVGKSISKKKKEQIDKLQDQDFQKMLEEQDLDLKDFGIDVVKMNSQLELENDPFIKAFQLGPPAIGVHDRERIRFQRGLSKICIFTYKSGGVGLSLHHCDDYMPIDRKVRRKSSGFAYLEDVYKVTSRPRRVTLTPVDSPIELVQGLGRVPRLTSLSDTDQDMVFYAGTVEEDVAGNVGLGMRCLKKVVRQKEAWQDMILGAKSAFKDTAASEGVTTITDENGTNAYELGSEVEEEETTEENK